MQLVKASNLACPLDGLSLSQSGNSFLCSNGHSFDIARQGYINLLPAHHKASKNPGDNKEMVNARAIFLDYGFYAPIAEQLTQQLIQIIAATNENTISILDAGCGEAYYLKQVLDNLTNNNIDKEISFVGMDISRPAIQAATRRSKQVSWVVASNKNIPVLPNSVDIILCMFGFPSYDNFKRILKHSGKLVQIDTGSEHLIELRRLIYPEIKEARPFDLSKPEQSGFVLEQEKLINYNITLDSNVKIMQLLGMTPHLYRAPKQGIEAVKRLDEITLSVNVVSRCFAIA